MSMQKFRWSKVYESSEEELMKFLQERSIKTIRIASDEAGELLQQRADLDSTLWCAEGSLVVKTSSSSVSLQPGDGLRVSAPTMYELQPGISGFVCYLSH